MASATDLHPEEMSPGESLVAAGATVMRVEHESMLAFSIQRPRDHEKILAATMAELDMVPRLAERCYYVIPYRDEGDSVNVTGPSIQLARILMRNWGNAASRAYIVSENEDRVHLGGVFTDLQTNVRFERPFVLSKYQKRKGRIVLLEGQWLMQAIQASASKAERNAITAGLPDWFVQSAFERVRMIAADSTKQNLSKIVEGFMRRGVTRERLEKHLGKPLEKLDNEELADLRGTYNALRDKEQGPESIGADPGEEQVSSTVAEVLGSGTEVTGGTESAAAKAQAASNNKGSVPNEGEAGRASSPPEPDPGARGSEVEADPAGGSSRQPDQPPTSSPAEPEQSSFEGCF